MLADRTPFCFPAIDRMNFAVIELEPHSGAAAILRNKDHSGLRQRGTQTPQGPIVRPADPRLEVGDHLQVNADACDNHSIDHSMSARAARH
ncbi:MAG TPA: hypothetical protein VGN07_23415 [Steroidobacteraceae bacterium]